ncbi:dihydrofolate reductase [Bartonella tamiae]|uniref:Dihydrofolate reductase n=1 Tax=Bartonella tamiae Th239 TaxID=1094558 RepID=J0QS16_9HYPH|nr:dihydrofolate reductase [Bartonella tamiae]EJF88641.1 hypothetical protein ME5_01192 [Bartonella tamiae Th239]EJF95109.1 hypothetical protein MEG_00690 [Bartonella tamiae Th307]
MKPSLALIVAVSKNGVIGRDGTMPWKLSTDLQRFKKITMAKPIIMGRKTWDSLGRPLPGRLNIVLSKDQTFKPNGAVVVHTLNEAYSLGKKEALRAGQSSVFVIGGGDIFKQSLEIADYIYMTEILSEIEGDTFFPSFDSSRWTEILSETVPKGEKDSHPTRFVIYQR